MAERARGVETGTPARLGVYVLREQLGTRGLFTTWRARHELLGRAVLVKTLKPNVSPSSPFSRALDREAQVLARLRHPGIVELIDFSRTDEAVWMVLDDGGGWPLIEVLAKAARLPPESAAAIALELSRALDHAHKKGIVHKSLRPDAITVDPTGRVQLADFATSHDPRTPSIPVPFEGGETFGRPDYLAPEQILGDDPGPEADVFAVGVIVHELIAGRRPFDDTPQPSSTGPADSTGPATSRSPDSRDVAVRIRSAAPPPLSRLVPGTPAGIERVVARCLAKRPEDRYASGGELASALSDALQEATRLPARVLVTRALAAAGLAEELPAGAEPTAGVGTLATAASSIALGRTAVALGIVTALVVAGATAIQLGLREEGDATGAPAGAATGAAVSAEGPLGTTGEQGFIRVVARPWAEILIDGEPVDVTPMARSIPVSPGRHWVTFRHPAAPDEQRSVKVGAGQTVLLDVTMRVVRPDAGTPRPASSSP